MPAGDTPLQVDSGDRGDVRDLGAQRGEIGGAARRVECTDGGDLGDRREEVAHAGDDLVQLGGGELRLPERQLVDLGLAAAPEVELVVGLDRDCREERYGDEQEQPMGERHAPLVP